MQFAAGDDVHVTTDAIMSSIVRCVARARERYPQREPGAWWDRSVEIDLLAISENEQTALVGECKWSVNPVGTDVLEDLKHKSQVLVKDHGVRRLEYALFSRSGFTVALRERAETENVGLFSVDDLTTGN